MKTLNSLFFSLFSSLLLAISAYAADIDTNADKNDLAIEGYDTVAYFTKGKPVKGSPEYSATYKNAIYHFSSAKHRDLFKKSPESYAPQYGGYCAFGVTKEKKYNTDPTAWKIVNGKLYLNLNHKVQIYWEKKIPEYIAESEQVWQQIKDVPAKKL